MALIKLVATVGVGAGIITIAGVLGFVNLMMHYLLFVAGLCSRILILSFLMCKNMLNKHIYTLLNIWFLLQLELLRSH